MTPKQLITDTIAYKKTERTPVAVLDGYLWMFRRNNLSWGDFFAMDAQKAADFVVENYKLFDSDIVYAALQATDAVSTVMGAVKDYTAKASPITYKKSALTDIADIKNFDAKTVAEKSVNLPETVAYMHHLELLAEKTGSEKHICSFATGPLTAVCGYCGIERLMMAMCEDDDDLYRMLDFAVSVSVAITKNQIEHGCSMISLADPLSSVKLISEEFFEKFTMPYLKQMTEEMAHFNVPVMLHICGDTTSRLVPLKTAGIDILSVDAIDMAEALRVIDKEYALFGNLSTVDVMLGASPEKVYEEAGKICRAAEKTGGIILAPGCDLPPATPYENIRAMVKAAKN